jgi:hypothetical protein
MKIFILVALLFPFFVFADTYQDAAGASQMVADGFDDLWVFLFTDTPNMMERFMAYALEKFVQMKLWAYFEFIKMSYNIAKVILADLNVMSTIASNMTLLPQDVRQMLVETRLFDGVNLLIQAYATKFVMRIV